jgi:nitrite reductase/ring-hydroxylating ferredoxin subunit/uncharacterized membrane protein
MARLLARLMESQDGWIKPFGTWLHGIVVGIFRKIPVIRDLLNGRWLGHSLHAALTDAPIGILFLVIVFDVIGQPTAANISLVVGVLAMLGAALAGLADYSETDGVPRDRATLHATLMVSALVVYLVSGFLRFGNAPGGAAAVWLSIVGFLVLTAGAYVGGHVVYALGNMVSRHAFRGSGTKWIALEPAETSDDGAIPEGRPVKAKLGINQLVLVRDGSNILALHDTCAHAGGPLSEGKLADGVIECPWHASCYRMADGHVVRGPSTFDQPAYEVRPREGGGWEARRQA